jgi:hypothetical protein
VLPEAFSGKIMVYWTIGTDESAKTELMVEDRVIETLITSIQLSNKGV